MASKAKKSRPKDPNVYPRGLNRTRVQKIIDYYERYKDEDLFRDRSVSSVAGPVLRSRFKNSLWLEVPAALLPEVKKMIERYAKKRAG